jgi:C-terminal processing protease CtpA/Prc
MRTMQSETATTLRRWKLARRLALASIVAAGVASTVAAATVVMSERGCSRHGRHEVSTGYTYPGIGVELEQKGEHFVVRRVFENTPADGKLFPGAVLIAADGQSPTTTAGWTSLIRGDAGTSIELEIAYPCSGHEKVTLTRELIHVRY